MCEKLLVLTWTEGQASISDHCVLGIYCEVTLWWMSQDVIDDKLILDQIITWCFQAASQYLNRIMAPSYYLNQCWPRYDMSSEGEKRRTRRTFPMARPKCQMGDFTNLYEIYKAHQTNVWWIMKVFGLHCMSRGHKVNSPSKISIKIQNFSFTKMHLKISSAKWWPCFQGEMN